MADKTYKLRDVEKGKKIEFITEYYKWHIIGALLFIIFISIGVYQYTHLRKNDISILLIEQNTTYNQEDLNKIQNSLESMEIDFNNDGKKVAYVQPIIKNVDENSNSGDFNELAYSELSVGECNIIIFDEDMFEYLVKHDALLSIEGKGIIKIPYENTIFNSFVDEKNFGRKMFVSFKKVNTQDDLYKSQFKFFTEKIIQGDLL